MEVLSKPVRMSPDMARLLGKLRAGAEPYSVYQQPADEADEKVCKIALAMLTDANLNYTTRNAYMWYVRELARLLRTRYGWDLAFHLELVMRKWQTLGLSPNIMGILTCEVHNALKPGDVIRPTVGRPSQKPKGNGKKPETRNPKSESGPNGGKSETRNSKPESDEKSEGQAVERKSDIDDSAGGLL